MPAEGRENPLLKKGIFDAFFKKKSLTKNICTDPVFDDAAIEAILNASDSPCNHALQCLTSDWPQPICRPHYIRHCHTGNQRHHSWLKRHPQLICGCQTVDKVGAGA